MVTKDREVAKHRQNRVSPRPTMSLIIGTQDTGREQE